MSPWIVRGDRVRFANNRRGPVGVVTGLTGDSAWVRWDGSKTDTKISPLSRLEVLGSARRDRAGNVRGELDDDCLVRPESIGWYDEPRGESELERLFRQLFPESE